MLRKLVFLGVFAGLSASIPALYENNPDAVQAIVRAAFDRAAPHTEEPRPTVVAGRAESEGEMDELTGRRVRIRANPRGHYHADFRLNGLGTDAMVDTGATYVAINRSTARRIGLHLGPSDFKYEVKTANGRASAAAASIDDVQIGRIYVEDVQAVVLDDEALEGTLVGMSFLDQLRRFEVENGSLLLEQ